MRGRRCRAAVVSGAIAAMLLAGCGTDAPESPPPPAYTTPGLVWVGDIETGDLSQFEDTPWNLAGGAPPPEVVTDAPFLREGRYAVAFTIPGVSDGEGITADSRNELVPRTVAFREGDEYWFAFSMYLAEDFPVQDGWQVVTQWKNEGEGSPPVELEVDEGEFFVGGGSGHPDGFDAFRQSLGPAVTGRWIDWTFRIRFSAEPDDGEIEVWRDGEAVLPTFRPESGTLYPPVGGEDVPDVPQSYLKTGYYRDAEISAPGTLYYDGWKIGTTAESVE